MPAHYVEKGGHMQSSATWTAAELHTLSDSQILMTEVILTDDVVLVGIVHQTAMLLMDEHELGGGEALDIGQVDMDEHEDDEHVHAEVVDDAHGHEAARPAW